MAIVRSRLEGVAEEAIAAAVADGWALRIGDLRYLPEGGGAYHWIAQADDGRRWFVTCDDLDTKPWLGAERDWVFDGLMAAYSTAIDLRAAGLSFVAAPIASVTGAPAVRLGERHSISVFEYLDGEPGQWGHPIAPKERGEFVTMLARLHATPATRDLARRGLEVPGRARFERALDDLEGPWDGGPLSEPARGVLAGHLDVIVRWFIELDRLAYRLGETEVDPVLTHGEPHPGNLIRADTGLMLVDWDTVAVAPAERDLWMFVDDGGTVLSAYRDLTGVTPDREGLAAYRLLWALSDVAAFTAQLRAEHRRDADAEKALAALRSLLDGREPDPYGATLSR